MPVLPPEWLAREYYGDDVNKLADVARSPAAVDAARGDRRRPELDPALAGNIELGGRPGADRRAADRDGRGVGRPRALPRAGAAMFDRDEIDFARAIAPLLADGARRALLLGEATTPRARRRRACSSLSSDWELESATPGVERGWPTCPSGDWDAGRLPSAVLAVAARALRSAEGRDEPGEVALARVLTRSGRWVVLHGATLVSDGRRRDRGDRRAGASRAHRRRC